MGSPSKGIMPPIFDTSKAGYNGYIAPLANNFGGVRGALDTLATSAAWAMYTRRLCWGDVAAGDVPFGNSACCLPLGVMRVTPSLLAMALLFPSRAWDTQGSPQGTLMRLLQEESFFSRAKPTVSQPEGSLLYMFKPEYSDLARLLAEIEIEKQSDFSGLGAKFKAATLGRKWVQNKFMGSWAYGLAVNIDKDGEGLMYRPTLNFAVQPFQEAFAYLFFSGEITKYVEEYSDGGFDGLSMFEVKKMYAFALNMLIRRYSVVVFLCDVCVLGEACGIRSFCLVSPTPYPPKRAGDHHCGGRPSVSDMASMRSALEHATLQEGVFVDDENCPLGRAPSVDMLQDGGYAFDANVARKNGDESWSKIFNGENEVELTKVETVASSIGGATGSGWGRRLLQGSERGLPEGDGHGDPSIAIPRMRRAVPAVTTQSSIRRSDGKTFMIQIGKGDGKRFVKRVDAPEFSYFDYFRMSFFCENAVSNSGALCNLALESLKEQLSPGDDPLVVAFYKCDGSLTKVLQAAVCDIASSLSPGTLRAPECPTDLKAKKVYLIWGTGVSADIKRHGGAKTTLYNEKGAPAASRLDTLMNGAVDFLASA